MNTCTYLELFRVMRPKEFFNALLYLDQWQPAPQTQGLTSCIARDRVGHVSATPCSVLYAVFMDRVDRGGYPLNQ